MNPIMGKLGNSVAQLPIPTVTTAGVSDATTTGAALPTAFAALLSNLAVAPKAVSFASNQPKAAEVLAASAGPVASNDLLVTDLPLGHFSTAGLPKAAPVSTAPVAEAEASPGEMPENSPVASDNSLPLSTKSPMEQRRLPVPAIASSRAHLGSSQELAPEPANTSVPSDEKPVEAVDVGTPEQPKSVDPQFIITAPAIAVAITPPPGKSAPAAKTSSASEARIPTRVVSDSGKSREPATQLMAGGKADTGPATRLAPKELPPEFAAVLAASTTVRSKPVGDKPEQVASKAVASQIEVPAFGKAVTAKDVALPLSLAVDHLRAKTSEGTADEVSMAPTTANAQPVTAPVSPQTPSMPGGPVADLSASLGQQVIDMGSGGQWIEGLAHEIAALSKGEGHGSFRLSPEHLGPMRVDIRPGDQGANVTLTVEAKAAESMLMQDRNILKADAQLTAVKIGDVTVERVAHVHEPARADTATGQGTGQGQGQTSSQTASQGNGGQGSSQAALAQGQGQGQGQSQQSGNHAGNRKVSSDAAVSSQAEPRDAGDRDIPDAARRARYA